MTLPQRSDAVSRPNVALAGGMGAGKTEVSKALSVLHGYTLVKISTPIYDIARMLWPEPTRHQLQELGIKLRDIDPDVWLNLYVSNLEGVDYAVVNDTLRMPNEYWKLKELGFYMVRVNAPEALRVDRLMKIGRINDLSELQHDTEGQLFGAKAEAEGIKFDYEIDNDDDDPVRLERQVNDMMLKLEAW